MKKSQSRDLAFRGEITAFMAMLFILMVSVVGALIESASIQITKNRKRADTLMALESAFAEYHPELLEQYEIFARFGCTNDVLNNRLTYYGAKNIEHKIEQTQLLSDYKGTPFYQQAVRYMKDWLGMEDMSNSPEYDFSFDKNSDVHEKEHNNSLELESLLEEQNAQLPTDDNPIESMKNLKKSSLLTLLVSNQEELSNRSIPTETLPSNRVLQKGSLAKENCNEGTDKLFFVSYLLEHFSDMTDEKKEKRLLYEQEYLLGGFASDQENLEAVCKKIMNIRMISNYTYLLTDSAKQAEAQAMALTLCSVISFPGITEVVKQALLFAWSYGESIVDTRTLLKGNKVPLVKTSESWQLQLSNLSSLGTANEIVNEKDTERGLSYQDYLKGLFLLEDRETLSMRCLDLIESNLHIKTDQCMTKVEIRSAVHLQRGIQDSFTTTYEYH